MYIGFSTGSLAYGDFNRGIAVLDGKQANVVELSALREAELEPLIHAMDHLDLHQFKYVSFHAPNKIKDYSEAKVVELLHKVAERGWPIILHPDTIKDFNLWRQLGSSLCIENMDKRKPFGRTTQDLNRIFDLLPEAGFCFDLAHVKQVDPTMTEGLLMLKQFMSRLRQLHISDVNSMSTHEPLNLEALISYRRLSYLMPKNIPVVIESPVLESQIQDEIKAASYLFDDAGFDALLAKLGINSHPSNSRHFEMPLAI